MMKIEDRYAGRLEKEEGNVKGKTIDGWIPEDIRFLFHYQPFHAQSEIDYLLSPHFNSAGTIR